MTHLFAMLRNKGQLFMPQGLVSREVKPADRRPQAPGGASGGKAKIGGLDISEDEVAANLKALKEIEEKKLNDLRMAIPDESLNLSEQQETLQRYEEEQRAQKREEENQRYEEEQRTQRGPPLDETHRYADVAAGRTSEPRFQKQGHVRDQGERLGVPSGPELKKAQSLPYPKQHEHPYEDTERYRSGGLEATIQGNLHRPKEPQPTYPQHGYVNDPPPYHGDSSQQAHPETSRPMQPFPSGKPGCNPSLIPPTRGPHGPEFRRQTDPSGVHGPYVADQAPQVSEFQGQTDASRVQWQYAAFAQPPGEAPKLHFQLSIGSTVQLSNPPRYGVIRWIGDLPAVQGLIAGIELVSK